MRTRLAWRRSVRVALVLACSCWAVPGVDRTHAQGTGIEVLQEVGIDQRLGERIPLDLVFRDESGSPFRLGDAFGHRPVILNLVYYECPMLCTQVLNGLLAGLRAMEFGVGDEIEVVTVSIDPGETPTLAAEKKALYIGRYDREGAASGWHFLTGEEGPIRVLADAVGFRYVYDAKTDQFIHASGIMLLTPGGKLARYYYGIEYAPRDLRLGLVEASEEKIGSPVDQILLYCFHYDPETGKYSLTVMNILRLVGSATVLAIGALVFVLIRRDRVRQRVRQGV